MSVEFVRRKAQDTIFEIGRGALHAIAPDDFELYACTFELIDSQGVIEDIFHFPVMPSGISVGRQSLVNIKKSGTAYMSQFNDSFVGRNVNLSGTFGKKFRLMISKGEGANIHEKGGTGKLFNNFDLNVKTGYGAVKLLERIIESSQKLDDYGNPKLLVFYNSTINHNHVIEVLNFQLQQSLENNMMWNWSIEIKSVANVDDLLFNGNSKKHLIELLAVSTLNKVINKVFDNISLVGVQDTVKALM
jgi:hypothetical protein